MVDNDEDAVPAAAKAQAHSLEGLSQDLDSVLNLLLTPFESEIFAANRTDDSDHESTTTTNPAIKLENSIITTEYQQQQAPARQVLLKYFWANGCRSLEDIAKFDKQHFCFIDLFDQKELRHLIFDTPEIVGGREGHRNQNCPLLLGYVCEYVKIFGSRQLQLLLECTKKSFIQLQLLNEIKEHNDHINELLQLPVAPETISNQVHTLSQARASLSSLTQKLDPLRLAGHNDNQVEEDDQDEIRIIFNDPTKRPSHQFQNNFLHVLEEFPVLACEFCYGCFNENKFWGWSPFWFGLCCGFEDVALRKIYGMFPPSALYEDEEDSDFFTEIFKISKFGLRAVLLAGEFGSTYWRYDTSIDYRPMLHTLEAQYPELIVLDSTQQGLRSARRCLFFQEAVHLKYQKEVVTSLLTHLPTDISNLYFPMCYLNEDTATMIEEKLDQLRDLCCEGWTMPYLSRLLSALSQPDRSTQLESLILREVPSEFHPDMEEAIVIFFKNKPKSLQKVVFSMHKNISESTSLGAHAACLCGITRGLSGIQQIQQDWKLSELTLQDLNFSDTASHSLELLLSSDMFENLITDNCGLRFGTPPPGRDKRRYPPWQFNRSHTDTPLVRLNLTRIELSHDSWVSLWECIAQLTKLRGLSVFPKARAWIAPVFQAAAHMRGLTHLHLESDSNRPIPLFRDNSIPIEEFDITADLCHLLQHGCIKCLHLVDGRANYILRIQANTLWKEGLSRNNTLENLTLDNILITGTDVTKNLRKALKCNTTLVAVKFWFREDNASVFSPRSPNNNVLYTLRPQEAADGNAWVREGPGEQLSSLTYENYREACRVDYAMALNRAGLGRALQDGTSLSHFVELLNKAPGEGTARCSIHFGLLQAKPSLWCNISF